LSFCVHVTITSLSLYIVASIIIFNLSKYRVLYGKIKFIYSNLKNLNSCNGLISILLKCKILKISIIFLVLSKINNRLFAALGLMIDISILYLYWWVEKIITGISEIKFNEGI